MIVRQTRLLTRPYEIVHLQLTCLECKETSMYRVAGSVDIPVQCPHCRASWLVGEVGAERNTASELMSALHVLQDSAPAKYILELAAPDDTD